MMGEQTSTGDHSKAVDASSMNTERGVEIENLRYFVRYLSVKDLESIARVREKSWMDTYPNEGLGISAEMIRQLFLHRNVSRDPAERKARLQETLKDETRLAIGIFDADGRLIGFLFGQKLEEFNELQAIYLDPDFIGRGAGAELMRSFLAWADPAKPSRLNVVAYNQRAINFYEKFGYSKTAKQLPPHGDIMPQIEMERPSLHAR